MAPKSRSTPRARRANAPAAAQAGLATGNEIQPDFLNAEMGFEELKSRDVALLRTLAGLAKAVAIYHLDDDSFRHLVKFAYDRRIISAEKLGEIGRVDRTTASRWINGHSTPSALSQETILYKIAEDAASQANQLRETGFN